MIPTAGERWITYLEKTYDWPQPRELKHTARASGCMTPGNECPASQIQAYFFLRAADFFAARKEIPARIAFC